MTKLSITPTTVFADVQAIRQRAPLIHNITNFVVMQTTANALLAMGASPIMAHAEEEMLDIVQLANSLVINIGTLDAAWFNAMQKAIQIARKRQIPIVIDPVGAGATPFRTQAIQKLTALATPTIIRGNASEILALVSEQQTTKGVDSTHSSEYAVNAAKEFAQQNNCIVVVSGAIDICVSAQQQINIHNGHVLMTKVTGMGCTATALIGAFCAVNSNPLAAAAHAMITIGIVGEIAAQKSAGPGSFQPHFFDALYNLTENNIKEKIRVDHV
jgi:hydroxyethylthiazole kinase